MASITLAQSASLSQDLLLAGVIENIVTVNPMFEVFPFMEVDGNALAYNRELTLGDVQFGGVGTTIAAKAAATFTPVTANLTTLVGDAEVNGLIQATRSNINDQKAAQIASKAKSIGRTYQQNMITGDGTANTFSGLMSLLAAGQTIDAGVNGAPIDFIMLDELIDSVKDKDGQVDYIMMPARTRRSYFAALRALPGADIGESIDLPSGRKIPTYRQIPIFVNDYIPINQVHGTSTTSTTVFAGTFDDGSGSHGISGITAKGDAGVRVEEVGTHQTRDETISRVKFYCGLANFSELGLSAISGISN